MQFFGYSVNIIFVIVALLLFQRIFLFHVQFVNGMNTGYVQIRNEQASEQLIKVQFQVAMSGRYSSFSASVSRPLTTTQSVSVLRRNLVPRFYSVLRLSLGRGDLGTRLPRRLRNFFQFRPCLSY